MFQIRFKKAHAGGCVAMCAKGRNRKNSKEDAVIIREEMLMARTWVIAVGEQRNYLF